MLREWLSRVYHKGGWRSRKDSTKGKKCSTPLVPVERNPGRRSRKRERERGRKGERGKLDDARKGGKLKNSWHPLPWPLSTRSRDDDVPTDTPSRFLFRISFPYGSNGWIFFSFSYYFFRAIVLLWQRVKGRRLCLRANISIME